MIMNRPLTILVVENHEDTRVYLRKYLEQQGHRVHGAENYAEAVGQLSAESVEVLISDIGLPDGDGRLLLQDYAGNEKPFGIAMSGYGSFEDKQRSISAGYKHHLVKPFDPEELDTILSTIPPRTHAGVTSP